ncbi:MAG: hypothetical protein VB036_02455 [Propionicimonas sp.]|nr:hypothetical protein [Propionicimonas sp.]
MAGRPPALPFPMPDGPELRAAYNDLRIAAQGDQETKRRLGDQALLPRPWDPPTCREPHLRDELWRWLDDVVTWFNAEYVWDPAAGMVPPCWPHHPHLVHEIASLADQRRRAGLDTSSNMLEEWHRYTVPSFLERLKERTGRHCDEHHQAWPARARYARYVSESAVTDRWQVLDADGGGDRRNPRDPQTNWRLEYEDGNVIDPATGEVL